MLFGLLLIIVIDAILYLVLGSFIRSSYTIHLIGNAVLFLLGGMWVGWQIKTPSWTDAIIFGIACVIIFNLPPIFIFHRPFTARTIVILVSGFAGALAGVLFSGYLAIRFKSPDRENSVNTTKIASSVLTSALVLGATAFVLGFVGPMILMPNSNQGPLLGIFFTGPAGLFLGGILGFVIGIIREYSQAKEQHRMLRLVPKVWNWLLWASAIFAAAVIVFAIIYIPQHESRCSSIVNNSADLQKRDKSLTQLRARSLSDADIMLLQQFSLLDDLDFAAGYKAEDAKLTDVGLKNLSELNLPKLEQLMLGYCNNITDNGMQFVATIKTLKYLSLAPCPRITDVGLANLTSAASLETLDLRGCTGITDRGLDYLSKMQHLKEILLGGCSSISNAGIKELRKVLPNCKVEKDDQEWAQHAK